MCVLYILRGPSSSHRCSSNTGPRPSRRRARAIGRCSAFLSLEPIRPNTFSAHYTLLFYFVLCFVYSSSSRWSRPRRSFMQVSARITLLKYCNNIMFCRLSIRPRKAYIMILLKYFTYELQRTVFATTAVAYYVTGWLIDFFSIVFGDEIIL